MSYVVCKPCLGSLDRSCVEVCPVDCFYYIKKEQYNQKFNMPLSPKGEVGMLMIHPDECINCGACESECPVTAIFEDSSVPSGGSGDSDGENDDWSEFVKLAEEELMKLTDEELDTARCTSK